MTQRTPRGRRRSAPAGPPAGTDPTGPDPAGDGRSTRERILDVALDLFAEQGYDKTSLREIADVMGFTKAALYYHFASKEDMLMALHLRLHDVGAEAVSRIDDTPHDLASWSLVLQEMVGLLFAQRKLILLHERNAAAIEALHPNPQHNEQDHIDMREALVAALADRGRSVRERIRLEGAFGALFFGMLLAGNAMADIPKEQVQEELRGVIRYLLEEGLDTEGAGAPANHAADG